MKQLLLILSVFISVVSNAQNYTPSLENGMNLSPAVINQSLDARSFYRDPITGKKSQFLSKAEVLSYFNIPAKRIGYFPIVINWGGSRTSGVVSGGHDSLYMFIDGTNDTCLKNIFTFWAVAGSGGGSPTDTSHLSDRINLKKDKNDSTGVNGFTSRGRTQKMIDSVLLILNLRGLDATLGTDSISNHGIFLNTSNTLSGFNAYFFGDSETVGYQLENPSTQAWPIVLCNRLGLTAINNAVSGWTLQTMPFGSGSMEANLSSLPTKGSSDKFLFFAFGVNDHRWMGVGFDTATFRSVYNTVLDAAIAKNWIASQIVLVSPFYIPTKTYKTDSAGYSFTQASSQLRNQQFGSVVQSIATARGMKFVNGYISVQSSGADVLIQEDSLHLNLFGNISVANSVGIIVDTIKQAGNKFAVNGTVQLGKIKYTTPLNNGIYNLGLTLDGYLGLISDIQANSLRVTNGASFGDHVSARSLSLDEYTPTPTSGVHFHLSRFPSQANAFFGVVGDFGSNEYGRLHLCPFSGGTLVVGSTGFTNNGSSFQVYGGAYIQSILLAEATTLPTGSGGAVWRIGGSMYIYDTDGGVVNLGYNSSPVTIGSSGTDGLHFLNVKENAKFWKGIAIGPGINSGLDVRLKIDSGNNLIAPIRFTPHNKILNDIIDGSFEFDSLRYYISAAGDRDTIAGRKWVFNNFPKKLDIDTAKQNIRNEIAGLPTVTQTISGSYSTTGAATTIFTVTIGATMDNDTYRVNVTPTSALSAAFFYVTNKTTTTFDVVYLAGLTGAVSFDWAVFPDTIPL